MFSYTLNKPLVLLAILFAGQFSLHAAEFDPTRPPLTPAKSSSVVVTKSVNVDPGDYKLTSILISPQRQIAVINNQVVTQGDTVNASDKASDKGRVTVKDISASAVVLVKAGQVFKVRLPSVAFSKNSPGDTKIIKTNPGKTNPGKTNPSKTKGSKNGNNDNPVRNPSLGKTKNRENTAVIKESH